MLFRSTAPVKLLREKSLPQGRVEAFFKIDTGGDHMMQRPKEAGMVLVVRMGDSEYRQTIASCRNPARSTEFGGRNARELEVAMCNGEYWLVTEPGLLQVILKDTQPEQTITTFKLPDNVIAVFPTETEYVKRTIETAPVKHSLKTPLPQGLVEAFFELNTDGDQMSERPKEAGLVVVVRIGDTEYRQTIASCKVPGLGAEYGGGTTRELEVAMCNGDYWLVTEPGSVQVIRKNTHPEQSITQFKLPGNVRAVTPANRWH